MIYMHVPNADALGFERAQALFRLVEAAGAMIARDLGVDAGFHVSWEPERLSCPVPRRVEPEPYEALRRLRVVPDVVS